MVLYMTSSDVCCDRSQIQSLYVARCDYFIELY